MGHGGGYFLCENTNLKSDTVTGLKSGTKAISAMLGGTESAQFEAVLRNEKAAKSALPATVGHLTLSDADRSDLRLAYRFLAGAYKTLLVLRSVRA